MTRTKKMIFNKEDDFLMNTMILYKLDISLVEFTPNGYGILIGG